MRQAQIIVLDHRLLDEEPALRMVLLHEMLHAKLMTLGSDRKQRSAHGRRFVQELRRLLGRGEECLRSEVKFYACAHSAN
jgi:predicted metal-dependent hydrolase